MEDPWDVTCSACGSRFYRSELPPGRSFGEKLAVHREMGCSPLGGWPGSG